MVTEATTPTPVTAKTRAADPAGGGEGQGELWRKYLERGFRAVDAAAAAFATAEEEEEQEDVD